jgi:hypothetical protein
MKQLRTHGDNAFAADRQRADDAGREHFNCATPTQQAFELISRMDVARQHGNKAAFLAAQDELKTLVEQL